MLYVLSLCIPANTAEIEPYEEDLKLTDGVITRVEVEFPAGCAGLAHSYARRAIHQVFPTNPDGNLCSDNHVIVWNDYEDLAADPRILTIGGWNLDDTYAHTITWRVELTPREIAERLKTQQGMLAGIGRLLGIR
ncbi:MAG: hypothetical protein NTU91_14360 [Chloroflexi bacterium]|nr:hypothetical protein [Chloroflexota bacterium]